MDNKVVKSFIAGVALSGAAVAGPVAGPAEVPSSSGGASPCCVLKSLGSSIYEGTGFINSIKFSGRAHFNAASTNGYVDGGGSFSDEYIELRRFRFGTKVQLFNDFTLVAAADLNKNSSRDDVRFGYKSMDELYLKYALGNIGGVNDASISYGRMKFKFGAEGHTSSNNLKTVERSVIGNSFYNGSRPTGVKFAGKVGGFSGSLGVFSTDDDSQELDDWNDGTAIHGSVSFAAAGGKVILDGLVSDTDGPSDRQFSKEWATSAAYQTQVGNWDLVLNALYGKEEQSGDKTYGFVVMPSTFIIEDKLEFVARYEYAKSDGDNIGLSRYASDSSSAVIGGTPRGDEHHGIYAGVNYYLCGDNAKLQLGAEYETLEESTGLEGHASTFWFGFRSNF